jgi:tRNA 5-methylaminomethyl-2-thiouridine biosynthesis bifunctional protein
VTQGWQGLPQWAILDTNFGTGENFFETWQCWYGDAQRPQVLHYVALCPTSVCPETLARNYCNNPGLHPLVKELTDLWFGLLPGFHRFLLAQGCVVLTLCVGDTLKLLQQQAFQADAVSLSMHSTSLEIRTTDTSLWIVKAVTHCCRRGTVINVNASNSYLVEPLTQRGFVLVSTNHFDQQVTTKQITLRYEPPWTLKTSRPTEWSKALPVQRCAVIGAGLAGASVAAALARRGWQVQVLDQAATPAAGASGLPVGLVVPIVSSDDSSLSRLSRAGARLMLQQARLHLIEGQQWAPSGVLEREINGTPRLPAVWPQAGQAWSTESTQAICTTDDTFGKGLWHRRGAWLKPANLVRAWLNQPGVTFQGSAKVATLRQQAHAWDLIDESGAVLGSAERVIFANADGAWSLLQSLAQQRPDLSEQIAHLPAKQGMRGLLNWAMHDANHDAFPPFPVNGSGSVVAHVPHKSGYAWFMGSSYQPDQQPERIDQDNQLRNFEHLQALLPTLANTLRPSFESNQLHVWKGTRCVTADRLPLVGPVDAGSHPSLWLCAGMGSRGMSFSVLCAELLAARMGAEPLPIESRLAKSLNALRA